MNHIVVIDASLAIPWVVEESSTPAAIALLIQWQQDTVRLLVPSLFALEAGSALLNHVRRGTLRPGSAPRALLELLEIVTVQPDDHRLAARALEIAETLKLWKPHDSLYAALAEHERCEFWTGDERFYQAAHGLFPWIHSAGQAHP